MAQDCFGVEYCLDTAAYTTCGSAFFVHIGWRIRTIIAVSSSVERDSRKRPEPHLPHATGRPRKIAECPGSQARNGGRQPHYNHRSRRPARYDSRNCRRPPTHNPTNIGSAAIQDRPQRPDGKGTPSSFPPNCPKSCPRGLGCVRDTPYKPLRCGHAVTWSDESERYVILVRFDRRTIRRSSRMTRDVHHTGYRRLALAGPQENRIDPLREYRIHTRGLPGGGAGSIGIDGLVARPGPVASSRMLFACSIPKGCCFRFEGATSAVGQAHRSHCNAQRVCIDRARISHARRYRIPYNL